jgi:hypothetical protein
MSANPDLELRLAVLRHVVDDAYAGVEIDRTGLGARECEMLDLAKEIAEAIRSAPPIKAQPRRRSQTRLTGPNIVDARARFVTRKGSAP